MRNKLFALSLLGCLMAYQTAHGQAREVAIEEQAGSETATAGYTVEGIVLDGMLDEETWQEVAAISDFKQFEPVDGAQPSQRTEVRVLYGPNSLYIGAMLFDDDAGAIERALGRRDDFNRADWFLVSIDGYLDRRTAYVFGVNAAGVQFDAVLSNANGGPGGGPGGGNSNAPRDMDPSWDAIWYSNVRMVEGGWSLEIRVPYSMLRFPDTSMQTWGVHFTRRIPRLGEQVEWPHVPRTQRDNLVAQFGSLEGIQNVKPRRNIQISPYTVTGLQIEENENIAGEGVSSRNFDVGGDLKIGLGPNVTLDATINPDFGQVDADPAVLNLTAFEIFFQERRPFFVEGINIYQFSVGPGQLLYTRRIGADRPIIGATKLSGRTASGLSFGILGAATGDNFNPARGYGVARVSQQFGEYSTAGAIVSLFDATDVDDNLHLRSFAAGADWDLRLLDNQYGIEGFFAVTDRNWLDIDAPNETGFAGKMWFRKRQGVWNGFMGVDVFNDQFNPNDAGQLRQNNFIALLSRVEHEVNGGQPFGPFLRAGMRLSLNQQLAYTDGLDLGQELRFGSRWTLESFRTFGVDFDIENIFSGYDLYETRGLLPWAAPTVYGFEVDFETDERRNWQLEPQVQLGFDEEGGRAYQVGVEGKWSAGDRVSLSGEISGEWETGVTAWSANESFRRAATGWFIGAESTDPASLSDAEYVSFDDDGILDPLIGDLARQEDQHLSLFGRRDTRSVDFTLRSSVTLTPKLSIQLYSQLFAARGKYNDFQLHLDRDNLVDFDAYPKRDEFSFSSLQSNLVLRWEYRPGSSLYVVWTHGRRAEDVLNPLAPWNGSPYNRSVNDQFSNTFDIFPTNAFLIKLNYTFLY